MASSETPALRFGFYELDERSGELRRSGRLVKLAPQPLKVLALLAGRSGEVVLREEVIDAVWGRENVNVDFEVGLNHCIKQIRAALDDAADHPHYIETLPKRGYRFLAPVERLAARAPETAPVRLPPGKATEGTEKELVAVSFEWVWLARLLLVLLVLAGLAYGAYRGWKRWGPRPDKLMLLVLPLENLSGDPGQDYFSAGLTEEMITQLGRLKPDELGVFARTTSQRMKRKELADIRRDLRADYAIEGSVRVEGERVAISVQLIQLSDLTHMWAETYEQPMGNVLTIQREVAGRVADSLDLVLLPAEQEQLVRATAPVKKEAFEAYLRGRSEWAKRNPLSLQQSVAYFEEALAHEPDYALAWAALADTYALLGSTPYDMMTANEAVPKTKQAARNALELDSSLAEAHNAMAHALLFYDWDWETAEREFLHAIERNPGYATARQWYAEYLWAMGRTDEALAQLQLALASDPHSVVLNLAIGRHYYLTRQYAQAAALYQEAIEMDPNFFLGHLHLGLALVQTGQHEDALAALQKAAEFYPGSPLCLAALGYAQARAGLEQEAHTVATRLEQMARERPVQALYVAGVYAGLEDKDRTLEWLERAYQERSTYVIFLAIEPAFDPMRENEDFIQLVRRIGLPSSISLTD